MSRREKIEIDFAKACERAGELEAVALQLYDLARGSLPETLRLLGEGFAGDNADAFFQKGRGMDTALFDTAERLMKTARNIRFTAELIYRAEKSAEMMI